MNDAGCEFGVGGIDAGLVELCGEGVLRADAQQFQRLGVGDDLVETALPDNDRPIGSGDVPGPVSRRLAGRFRAITGGEDDVFGRWLTYALPG